MTTMPGITRLKDYSMSLGDAATEVWIDGDGDGRGDRCRRLLEQYRKEIAFFGGFDTIAESPVGPERVRRMKRQIAAVEEILAGKRASDLDAAPA